MKKEVMEQINADFKSKEVPMAIKELSSINLQHVMANSEYNLKNTRHSVLYLAKGNLEELRHMVNAAKRDFRDVIYWAIEEKKK